MEHRREPRVPFDRPVALTLLGDREIRLSASVKNASPRGIGVMTAQPLSPGAALKIEIGDSIFLGEVMYSRNAEGGYFSGIELTQVLTGLAALSRLAREFNDQLNAAPTRA
jgi:hypothetical protein